MMQSAMQRGARALTLGTIVLVASCGGGRGDGPVTVDAGADRAVVACESVVLEGAVAGRPADMWWSVVGVPLLHLEELDRHRVAFRAPALAVDTTLTFTLRAETAAGEMIQDEVSVFVAAAAESISHGPGSAPACAPFGAGVASGDPTADRVLLWTRLDPESARTGDPITWEIATDPLFRAVVRDGTVAVDAATDFTVHVDVDGLASGETYFYRFRAPDGRYSDLGRTRTAPAGATDRVLFAVASCSSIYSGYFNAYRRIAEREDLDLVIHLGDYIYDFVDAEEQVRIPSPFPQVPRDLAEWRARHEYYLADPDLRYARATHPWFLLWDNHDVERRGHPVHQDSVQAFQEWNPLRAPDPARPERIYRALSFGDLVDLVLLDVLLFRSIDFVPGTDGLGILGDEQWEWLSQWLADSTATWRVVGNQKLFGQARVNPNLVAIFDGERRDFFDLGTWDGFPEDRLRLLARLAELGHVDNLILSGDSHISIVMNVVDDYDDPALGLGGELLPTSISRGNFDEALGPLATLPLLQSIVTDTMRRNPHGVYLELTKHGYGTVDITAERIRATVWYSEILARSDEEEAGPSFVLARGVGHWEPEDVE